MTSIITYLNKNHAIIDLENPQPIQPDLYLVVALTQIKNEISDYLKKLPLMFPDYHSTMAIGNFINRD